MPSDDRIVLATEAVAGQADAFRSALATTVEQVRDILARHRAPADGQTGRCGAELGDFASDRIDSERFSRLFVSSNGAKLTTIEPIERAFETLSALSAERDKLCRVTVDEGGNLREAVAHALAHLGRAFGAARVVALSRSDRYRDPEHAKLVGAFPFERWNKTERRIAPPLIVIVNGRDLHAAGLVEFLDGAQKIVLIVNGECPPAALVRLISPGTFVLQTLDGTGLDRFAAWRGPGIAALVPDSAARFVHDPAVGAALYDRITIHHAPKERPLKPLGGISATQQVEELEQLTALGARAVSAPALPSAEPESAPAPVGPAGPADRLAAWLISQADLSDAK
jgi:hypothetical protein